IRRVGRAEGHVASGGAEAVVASLWGRLYAGRRRWVLRSRAGWRRPLAGANPAPQGHQPLAPAGLPPASIQQRAAQRVGQGVLDAHLGELTDQQRVVTAEVDDAVVLRAALQHARVLLGVVGHQDALDGAHHASADLEALLVDARLEDLQALFLHFFRGV